MARCHSLSPAAQVRQSPQRNTASIYTSYAIIGVVILAGIVIASQFADLNPTFHTVTGQLARYSHAHDGTTIHLIGDATAYSLPSLGAWPSPPQSLPLGASVTMLVDGKNIGTLDANDASAHWHITTQGYAEPWLAWIEFSGISGLFGVFALALLAVSVQYFWQRQRGIPPAAPLALFPAPTQGDTSQIQVATAQDLC